MSRKGRLGSLTVFQGGSGAKVHAAQVLHGAAGLLASVLPLEQKVLRLQISVQNAPAHTAHTRFSPCLSSHAPVLSTLSAWPFLRLT